jgi:hypothetical protein
MCDLVFPTRTLVREDLSAVFFRTDVLLGLLFSEDLFKYFHLFLALDIVKNAFNQVVMLVISIGLLPEVVTHKVRNA